MESYIHNKLDLIITEPLPEDPAVCYLSFRIEAILERIGSEKLNFKDYEAELLRLIILNRQQAIRMESRLRKYKDTIESLGFTRNK